MKFKTLLLCVLILSSFCESCKYSIESKLIKKCKDCEGKGCEIDLKDFTDFKWDKVYIYNHATTREALNDTLGLKYDDFVEFDRTSVFLYKNKIVHSENHTLWNDDVDDGQLVFDEVDYIFHVYTPNDSKFLFRKEYYGNDIWYYHLIHIANKK